MAGGKKTSDGCLACNKKKKRKEEEEEELRGREECHGRSCARGIPWVRAAVATDS